MTRSRARLFITSTPPEPVELPVPAVIPPVGAVVTGTGLTFSVAPANPLTVPLRVRCTSCPWQATVTGPEQLQQQTDRHASAHQDNPPPRIAYLPGWLQSWRKGTL